MVCVCVLILCVSFETLFEFFFLFETIQGDFLCGILEREQMLIILGAEMKVFLPSVCVLFEWIFWRWSEWREIVQFLDRLDIFCISALVRN